LSPELIQRREESIYVTLVSNCARNMSTTKFSENKIKDIIRIKYINFTDAIIKKIQCLSNYI